MNDTRGKVLQLQMFKKLVQHTLGVSTVARRTAMSSKAQWNPKLTPEQLAVLRDGATERANTGKYLKNNDAGVYSCANCHAPLYKSETKFDSNCGWPAFYEEISPNALEYIKDNSMGMQRTEIRCNKCGGHLGHVFEGEGWSKVLGIPQDVRHCVNSASLDFTKKGDESK